MQGSEGAEKVDGEAGQGCAVCKHQRKRCNNESCEFWCYFPARRYEEYVNAHRIFGLQNIIKILRGVEENQRQEAAETILIEGNARANNPVSGCYGILNSLHADLAWCEVQQAEVNKLLAICRSSHQLHQQQLAVDYNSPTSNPPNLSHLSVEPTSGQNSYLMDFQSIHQLMDCNQSRPIDANLDGPRETSITTAPLARDKGKAPLHGPNGN